MARRLGMAVLGAAGLALAACFAVARPSPPVAHDAHPTDQTTPPKRTYVGTQSCAAAGCHNGNDFQQLTGSEYSIWSARDPHGRAFAVLGEERSKKIEMAYRGDAAGDAGKDKMCLACHSLPVNLDIAPPPSDELLADGVSCEACHGPAGAWLDAHTTEKWRGRSSEEKEGDGFFPTRDLGRRTERCAACHVGRKGAEVDHDLIAAGHPRLAFEYTAYHDLLPRHWDRERLPQQNADDKEKTYGPDFSVRAWAISQKTAEQAAKSVIAARGRPDFSDYDCFGCHHDLGPSSWRQQRGFAGKPGQPVPETWYKSRAAEAKVDDFGPAPLKPERLKALLLQLTKSDANGDGPATWDRAMQTYLAFAALDQALAALEPAPVPPGRAEALRELRNQLKFPQTKDGEFDSPHDFTPLGFRDALKAVRATFGG